MSRRSLMQVYRTAWRGKQGSVRQMRRIMACERQFSGGLFEPWPHDIAWMATHWYAGVWMPTLWLEDGGLSGAHYCPKCDLPMEFAPCVFPDGRESPWGCWFCSCGRQEFVQADLDTWLFR